MMYADTHNVATGFGEETRAVVPLGNDLQAVSEPIGDSGIGRARTVGCTDMLN